ncbi:MAG: radical SAM protein [Clostridiales Family XIII bacterium]|nr:radical SAM protein [Clostridiales Family XIII bacterium]
MDQPKVFEIGPIRPPSEAGSLLLRVTKGCTWNKCKFCALYRKTDFRAYPTEELLRTIDRIVYYRDRIEARRGPGGAYDYEAISRDMEPHAPEEQECYYMVLNWLANGGRSAFLQDGNTMALSPGRLVKILRYLKESLPEIQRITSYGRAESLAKISVEQYLELKAAGLSRIHSGFESGSDEVLALIQKGVTARQEILAGQNVKKAGIEFSVYFMPGIGGKALSEKNAVETADVINQINPDFVRLRTTVINRGTDLWKEAEAGNYRPCTDMEKLLEIRLLISEITRCDGCLAGDHIINLLQHVSGRLDRDKTRMLAAIDDFLRLPRREQRRFQLARRAGMVVRPQDLQGLDPDEAARIDAVCASVTEPDEWEELLNRYLRRYI